MWRRDDSTQKKEIFYIAELREDKQENVEEVNVSPKASKSVLENNGGDDHLGNL